MSVSPRVLWAAAIGALVATAPPVSAQPLGVFRWQLQPHCNIVSLTVTQSGGIYTLDGTDDQCGGSAASITGLAFVNPNGSIGFGLTIVSAPGGAPVHVEAAISFPGLSGTWRDSAGRQGGFVLTPGAGTGGSPRPIGGSLGSAAIDPTQVQVRVSGGCPAGEAMAAIGQNGSVACVAVGGGGGTGSGDITSVVAGSGLIGGASSGDATLQVSFAGTGALSSVARSDHTHGRAFESVSVGFGAVSESATGSGNSGLGYFALTNLTTGPQNTAVGTGSMFSASTGGYNSALGFQSLNSLTSGGDNTAIGQQSMISLTNGLDNTAVGSQSLRTQSTGNHNVAVGYRSLYSSGSATGNTAIGTDALANLTTGGSNTAIGFGAGVNLVNGANNLYIGNEGVANETLTIRLGSGLLHSRLFLAATRGVTTAVNNAVPIMIDSQGQVGTISSSRRTKEEIRDLGGIGLAVHRLRPVQFRYIAPFAGGGKPVQYGLIAEEVEAVLPELVAYGTDGRPETVKYHVLPTLLLEEVQRLEKARAAQDDRLRAQSAEIAELRVILDSLQRELTALRR